MLSFLPFIYLLLGTFIRKIFMYTQTQGPTNPRLHHTLLRTNISLYLFYGSAGKQSACNAEDLGSIPGLGRSPGEGKSYPLQYSGLENSMDYMVHGVAKSWMWLNDFHLPFFAKVFLCKSPRYNLSPPTNPSTSVYIFKQNKKGLFFFFYIVKMTT